MHFALQQLSDALLERLCFFTASKHTTPTTHVASTPDISPSWEDLLNKSMGIMAGTLAKLCEQPDTYERPPGSNLKSTSDLSDILTLALTKTFTCQANGGVTIARQRAISAFMLQGTSWTTQTTFLNVKCSASVQRPPA